MDTINLEAIYTSNIFGIAILLMSFYCLRSTFMHSKRADIKNLRSLMILTIIACIVDPIVFTVDGHPGKIYKVLNILGNTYLCIGTIWMIMLWTMFLKSHLIGSANVVSVSLKRIQVMASAITGFYLLNMFFPIFFYIDANNVYHRKHGILVSIFFVILLLMYSIRIYISYKQYKKRIRFFPIAGFLVPVSAGYTFQMLNYGTSLCWPAVAVSLLGCLLSLQNEAAYIDSLTGLLNRSFLYNSSYYRDMHSGIMMDVNMFKFINDNYGHIEGDLALQNVAHILQNITPEDGFVVRYAGDEFIIFTKLQDKEALEALIDKLIEQLENYNRTNNKQYELSLSYGIGTFDPSSEDIDHFISRLDSRMYAHKTEFYEQHSELIRRH